MGDPRGEAWGGERVPTTLTCHNPTSLLSCSAMRPITKTVLHVHDLTKVFSGVTAVDHLSFSVDRGEIVGILGANGAGKTTTLQMILGLIRPTSGRIDIFGQELEQHRIEILSRMNFSSVGVNLPMNLRVVQNLWVFAKLYGVKDARGRLNQLLKLLEIDHLRDAITGRLSSGELSRVNLCKALLNRPQLLLLDEPTASLDPDIADKVRKILRQVQDEHDIAMLYTSHNMRDIEEICNRILFLHNGRLIAEGTPEQVVEQFRSRNLEEVFIRIARSGEVVAGGGDV
jgi:ABC-2 type transport system ATP-binding protein